MNINSDKQEEKKPVMYIFVNDDLNMPKGMVSAQCCHVTQIITEAIIRQGYESSPPPKVYFTYMKWRVESTTVILKATQDQLYQLLKLPNAYPFTDSGNRIPDNSLTVIGFSPSTEMDEVAKDYTLY